MKASLLCGSAIAVLASVLAPAAWAEAQVAEAGMGLETVTVSAEKRETNLQKTPIAISVISAQNLEDSHAGSLLSLQDGSIPSLRVATFEARQSALTVGIRGIVRPNVVGRLDYGFSREGGAIFAGLDFPY